MELRSEDTSSEPAHQRWKDVNNFTGGNDAEWITFITCFLYFPLYKYDWTTLSTVNTASEHITKMMRYTIGHLVTIIPNERQFVDGRCQVVDMFVYWWQWFYFIRANNRVLFEIMKHAIQLQLWVDDWFMTVLVKDVNESRWVETTLWTKPFVGMRGSIEPYKR